MLAWLVFLALISLLPLAALLVRVQLSFRLGWGHQSGRGFSSNPPNWHNSDIRITNFFSYSNVKGKQSDEMLCAICLEDFRAEDAIAELGWQGA
mmetsp:Transcript_26159/g.25881  ORF Transcript_26159/g.25881 Transcript_26159/m.25881 type:complete len:94 (+) Transcript_26159:56-337(+)